MIYVSYEELEDINNIYFYNRSLHRQTPDPSIKRYFEYDGKYYYLDYWLQ